ncbi:hypothetical protein [Thalassoglobus neptunius]|uniref:hypothetical protein n=1 Tax=Thalassoglobus neptunius TaxID=1938619 RepID=UPI0011B7DDFC|nr:hypothetical protein [Thalassoglobus neptunius]
MRVFELQILPSAEFVDGLICPLKKIIIRELTSSIELVDGGRCDVRRPDCEGTTMDVEGMRVVGGINLRWTMWAIDLIRQSQDFTPASLAATTPIDSMRRNPYSPSAGTGSS